MANSYFQFKQFLIEQDRCAMKVTTDACLFGAWVASENHEEETKPKSVLDIGAGTCLLSLMFAQKNLSCHIDAVEIDSAAYGQATENAAASPFTERIHMMPGDIKTLPLSKKYDVIISNPPFYEREISSNSKKKNVAHHQAGLLIGELLAVIRARLSTSGSFYLLLPFKRSEEIKKMLLEQNLFVSKIVMVRQSTKHDYFRLMIEGRLSPGDDQETLIEEIAVWNDEQLYTDVFRKLLKDYYLDF